RSRRPPCLTLFPYTTLFRSLQTRFLLGRRRRIDARVIGRAELRGQRPVVLTWIAAGARGDLGRQKRHDGAVLVGRPDRPVVAQEASAGALLAAEAERAGEQPRHEPLEAHR